MKGMCDNLGLTFVDGVKADGHLDFARKDDIPESSGVKGENGEIRPYVFAQTVLTGLCSCSATPNDINLQC